MSSVAVLAEIGAGYWQDRNAATLFLNLHQAALHVVRPMEAKKEVKSLKLTHNVLIQTNNLIVVQ